MFENIRKLRLEHKLTQKQLGDIAGITQQCVNNYENRSTYPSYDVLRAMADYFNVSMDYLCFGESSSGDRKFDSLMSTYTSEDLSLHDQLFSELPVYQKRTIDNLIVILSRSNSRDGDSA